MNVLVGFCWLVACWSDGEWWAGYTSHQKIPKISRFVCLRLGWQALEKMPIWKENQHHFNLQVLLVSFRERIHRKGNQNILMFEQICFTKIVVWWWHHKRYLKEVLPLISMLSPCEILSFHSSQKLDLFSLVRVVLTFYHGQSPWNFHFRGFLIFGTTFGKSK